MSPIANGVSPNSVEALMEGKSVLHITPRERQALRLLAWGKEAGDIGLCLGVPVSEVGSQLAALFARMGAKNGIEAIADASRRGLLSEQTSVGNQCTPDPGSDCSSSDTG